jgi:hypothetical protein
MPTKTREYYLTTNSSRDFAWFFFRIPPTRLVRAKPDPPPPHKVPKMYRATMPSIAEEPGQGLVAHAEVKTKPESTRANKSKPKKGPPKTAGPWSEWYVSEDGNYFWRARQTQDSMSDSKPYSATTY